MSPIKEAIRLILKRPKHLLLRQTELWTMGSIRKHAERNINRNDPQFHRETCSRFAQIADELPRLAYFVHHETGCCHLAFNENIKAMMSFEKALLGFPNSQDQQFPNFVTDYLNTVRVISQEEALSWINTSRAEEAFEKLRAVVTSTNRVLETYPDQPSIRHERDVAIQRIVTRHL